MLADKRETVTVHDWQKTLNVADNIFALSLAEAQT